MSFDCILTSKNKYNDVSSNELIVVDNITKITTDTISNVTTDPSNNSIFDTISSETTISMPENTIKHLVFSGGGPAGLISYGACKQLHKDKFWELKNIKSIYGTSIGALVGLIVSLGYEWNIMDDYLIKRPWNKVFKLSLDNFLNCFYEKGLLGKEVICSLIEPLLKAKDLAANITFEELYKHNGIELHMYTANINNNVIELVDLSYLTHKDLSICNGLCMTMSYPFVFKPVIIDNICYIDGGILNNFPLHECIEQQKCDENDILAFKTSLERNKESVNEESTIADYLYILIEKMQKMIRKNTNNYNCKNIVRCFTGDILRLHDWMNIVLDESSRTKLINKGVDLANVFLKNKLELSV